MKKIKKLRVAAYIRVSTDEKSSKGASTGAQKKAILDFINRNSDIYEIDKKNIYIDNGYSGATDERPEFKNLIKDAENNKFDIVIVWKIDRFFRKIILLLGYIEVLYNLGIEFKSITQNFETSGPFGKSVLSILGVIAELERDLIIERTILGRRTKAENGYYVGGGKTPLGYNKVQKGGGNILEIDKEESELVKKVFDLFINEKKSINEIAKIFTDEKVETKNIKKNDNLEKGNNSRGVWHPKTISELLKNTKYIGKYYYGRMAYEIDKTTGKRIEKIRDKEDWIELNCPKIIDENLFNQAQVLIEKNKLIKNNDKTHTFTGLINCSHCLKNYVGYRTSKKTISYKCNGSKRDKMKGKELCKNEQISELILFETIWNKLDYIFKNPKEVLESYYNQEKEGNEIIKKLKNEEEILIKNIDDTMQILEKMQEDYYGLIGIRKITQDKLIIKNEDKINNMYSRLNEVKERIKEFNNVKENTKNLIKLFNNYKQIYKNLSNEDKLGLIKEFVEKVEINGNDINVIFKFSIKKKDKGGKNGDNYGDKEISSLKEKKTLMNSGINAVTGNTIGIKAKAWLRLHS